MLNNEFHIKTNQKAILVSLISETLEGHRNESEMEYSLGELKELCRTLNIEVIKTVVQKRKNIDPATLVGKGKLEEINKVAQDEQATLLIFDTELTAGQVKNIKSVSDLSVIDRYHVILEIFATHAKTRESKIQIEIARLQYILPRLSGFWGHLSRQRGGVGVLGGEGEKQIELDRRLIRSRIEQLNKELKSVKISHKQQKKRRLKNALTVALVGYTNAGKSSIMNGLCKVDQLSVDKLFATLDSTTRMLNPDTKPPMLLADTVGFISNLPNTLIDGFKTTLESAIDADLLLVVCDVSDPNYKKHLLVTDEILTELGVEKKKRFIIFNKKDLLPNDFKGKIIARGHHKSFLISSLNSDDIDNLREYIQQFFLNQFTPLDIFVPYEKGNIHATVRGKANIVTTEPHKSGIYYKIKMPDHLIGPLKLSEFILSPEQKKRLQKDF